MFLKKFIPPHVVDSEFDPIVRLFKEVKYDNYSNDFMSNILINRIVRNLISLLKNERINLKKYNLKPIDNYFNSNKFSTRKSLVFFNRTETVSTYYFKV